MSRLDQHIDAVRTRFLIQKLLHYAAWVIACACTVLCLSVVLSRFFDFAIPPMLLMLAGAGALVGLISAILALATSPSRHATAVKIDEVLKLQERYSTALYARGDRDEFAQAALSDAEHTANMVSIRKRFPMQMPRMAYPAMSAALALLLADRYMPQLDLFGREEAARKEIVRKQKEDQARQVVEKALMEVNAIPKVSGESKALQAARRDLDELLKNPINDPTEATVTAQKAMQQAQEAARQRIEEVKTTADKVEQADIFRPLSSSQTGGFYEDFKKSVTESKFDKAATDMKAAIDKFNKADTATQEKMAAEMTQMAEQLAKIANDPSVQGQIQKQLEQAGATPDQAKQMMREMEKAAAGNQASQQRVRDMAENLARKMNGGILPAPAELATFMQKMQQAQAKMQAQDSAGQMAQAASKMAQAMQNAQRKAQAQNQPGGQQQQGQPQAGQKGNQGQQANSQQQQGQQANQQQQQGTGQSNQQQNGQGQQQMASQQGKQGGGDQQQGNPGQSQMADAQQQMQDALNNAQGKQDDTGGSMASGNGEGEDGAGGQWDAGQGQGQGGQGGQGMGQGFSGPNRGGIGMGERRKGGATPYTTKKEVDKGEMDDKGKVLSSSFVKADSIKGESKEQLKQIIQSAQRDAADDIDRDRVPMQARDAVQKYFDSVQQDLK